MRQQVTSAFSTDRETRATAASRLIARCLRRPGHALERRPLGEQGELAASLRQNSLWWLLGACAAAYLLAVIVSFRDVITSVYVDSDAASGPVLAQALGHAPAGSYVSLGNHPWYEEWLFLLATRGAPGYRELWQVAPALVTLLGLAIFGLTARRVWGAGPALLSTAALLCVGAFGRFCFLAFGWRSFALAHTILLVAVSLWFLERSPTISWRGVIVISFLMGAASVLPAASDPLFAFWALGPLLVASIAASGAKAWGERGRLAAFVAIVLVVSAAGAIVVSSALRADRITARALPLALADPSRLGHNFNLLAEGYAYLAGGRLVAPQLDVQGVVVPATALLVLAALGAGFLRTLQLAGGQAAKRSLTPSQVFHAAFWGTSLIATSLVFVGTTAPRDALSGRYLLGSYAAIAALLPLIAGHAARARRVVTLGVCAIAVIATYEVLRSPYDVIKPPQEALRFPGPSTAGALARFARHQGVIYGYGGYWDAQELTWATDFRVLIRPVRVCPGSPTFALCFPQLGMISGWYTPKRNTRSLLVVDSAGVSFNGVLGRDLALGRPLAMRQLDGIAVYVYPYDIASRLARPPCHFSWAHPC